MNNIVAGSGETATLFPVVAAALVDADGKILLQRRPSGKAHAGLWEFPGGKVEPGETPETALVRELREELGIAVAPDMLEPAGFSTEPLPGRHLLLMLYVVRGWRGTPVALEADGLVWRRPEAMGDLPMPPADPPLVRQLRAYLGDSVISDAESASGTV
ncbi:(deoxy)nucleoside triphosphate pyrophosphohydrolase [Sphingomonadaceae bacterium jetA1]|jgi:8-oxo-dGTP diphosphatase|uniref:(deoxy)nucleoside triphosphate pyrophosphohydrolase n=1 Tax=Facivitalis istanbulensis TaxID=3075838 RepID=UPI003496367B